jgi:hypothetical protein
MSPAEFHIQYWARKELWNRVESKEKLTMMMMTLMLVSLRDLNRFIDFT